MREPPGLAESVIGAVIDQQYDIAVTGLAFLPIGNDAASFAYRVDVADGRRYFLKIRAESGFNAASLIVPRWLSDQGVPHIVAPIRTTTHALWVELPGYVMSLYPFIDARPAADTGLSESHWYALGAALQQIHTCHLPAEAGQIVRRETLIPSRRRLLDDLESMIAADDLADPVQRELAAFWRARRDDMRTLIERADALGDQLRTDSLPSVLCHADLHTWNVLLDADGQMWIVDWDEVVLAPKERDLMFVIGGIGRGLVSPRETACFLRGYGDPAIDRRALVYYRYAWAVQDMAAYAEEVFCMPNLSEQTRRDALRGFIDLFAPGNIVAIARESDDGQL